MLTPSSSIGLHSVSLLQPEVCVETCTKLILLTVSLLSIFTTELDSNLYVQINIFIDKAS